MGPPSHRPSVEGARSLGKDGRTYVARSAAPRPRSSDRRYLEHFAKYLQDGEVSNKKISTHATRNPLKWVRLYADDHHSLRCPQGSPLLEPVVEGEVAQGANRSVWIAHPDPKLKLRWKKTRRVNTKQVTLGSLADADGRTVDVYAYTRDIVEDTVPYRLRPTGNIVRVGKGGRVTTVATLRDAAARPAHFVGDFVQIQDASGHVMNDDDTPSPVICSGGRLAFNCITDESYLRIRRVSSSSSLLNPPARPRARSGSGAEWSQGKLVVKSGLLS